MSLFEKFNIPSAFIAESMQNISRSFAAKVDVDGTTYVWFHFLCKIVSVEGNRIVGSQRRMRGSNGAEQSLVNTQDQSQEDLDWLKPGFVLKIRKRQAQPHPLARSRTSSSDATMSAGHGAPLVELFCFGAPSTMGSRFQRLKKVAICDDLVQDPYVLLEVVFEEMYKVLDSTGWAVSHIFGKIERVSVRGETFSHQSLLTGW